MFPRDFEEAARIDGAARWQILWNVIVPMARPAIAVLALFWFIGLLEKSFLTIDRRQYTRNGNRSGRAQPFLRPTRHGMGNYMMAASTISILPTAILTAALQKYIIEGISTSGFGGR